MRDDGAVRPDTDEELLDAGARRRIPAAAVLVAVLVLALGVGIGFTFGHRTRSAGPAPPTPVPRTRTVTAIPAQAGIPAVPGVFQDIDTSGQRCSAIVGGKLQLGIEVTNHANTALQLVEMSPVLPLGGLRMTARAVGSCGQLTPPTPVFGYRFAPDATIWVTATFDVEVRCPAFVPVSFVMRYHKNGNDVTESLAGFGDLGDVPYPCPSSGSTSR